MDAQPVAIEADVPASLALEEYFWRYRWSWFAVVDADGRFAGIARESQVQEAVQSGEGWVRVGSLVDGASAAASRISIDSPITELLVSESLGHLGAVMAVDDDGILRGVVTVEQVRRALSTALTA
jgi:predicted transcriptional regulator